MHNTQHFALMSLCVASLTTTPAAAQPAPPGTVIDRYAARLPTDPGKVTTNTAMRVMDRYGQCLVTMRAMLADVATGPYPQPKLIGRALSEPGVEGCLQATKTGYDMGMQFNFELLRGSVYKALYRQRHRAEQPAFTRQPFDLALITSGMNSDNAKRFTIFHKIAECTLAAAPAPAHQLVVADYGSDPHKAAFAALAPVIGDCLPEGVQLELPRPALAGALAEVAWRQASPKS